MTFKTEMWHPNVYPSGLVCISILHPPEEDKYGYEDAGERWLPVHTPHTILLSVISMVRVPYFVWCCGALRRVSSANDSYPHPMMSLLRIPTLHDSGAMTTLATRNECYG